MAAACFSWARSNFAAGHLLHFLMESAERTRRSRQPLTLLRFSLLAALEANVRRCRRRQKHMILFCASLFHPTAIIPSHLRTELRGFFSLQYLTLAFIGFISASSMRGFLRDMRRAFSAIAGGGNATTLVLLLTELMGLYAISSLLLIRKQLPLRYR